jgi:hypothetical protein
LCCTRHCSLPPRHSLQGTATAWRDVFDRAWLSSCKGKKCHLPSRSPPNTTTEHPLRAQRMWCWSFHQSLHAERERDHAHELRTAHTELHRAPTAGCRTLSAAAGQGHSLSCSDVQCGSLSLYYCSSCVPHTQRVFVMRANAFLPQRHTHQHVEGLHCSHARGSTHVHSHPPCAHPTRGAYLRGLREYHDAASSRRCDTESHSRCMRGLQFVHSFHCCFASR